MKVAVVHETAFENGGGVKIAEELARTFDAPIYFGFCESDALDRVDDLITTHQLFKDSSLRLLRHRPTLRHLYYMWAFQYVPEIHKYDVVIQSGSGADWYVPPEDQTIVRYVHAPAGVPYHAFTDIADSPVTRAFATAARLLRTPTIFYPTRYVVNSELTKRRVKKYLGQDSEIVYPPVETHQFGSHEREDFYLSLSRLTRAKQVDEVVETFTEVLPDKQLVVAGSGPLEDELRAGAGDNVDVKGWVSEETKRDLLGSCQALILNSGNESFGIVPIEAFASGTPVIALNRGYSAYQIEDGWNGLCYEHGNLPEAIWRFCQEGVTATHAEIEAFAERFSTDQFRDAIRRIVREAREDDAITPVSK